MSESLKTQHQHQSRTHLDFNTTNSAVTEDRHAAVWVQQEDVFTKPDHVFVCVPQRARGQPRRHGGLC